MGELEEIRRESTLMRQILITEVETFRENFAKLDRSAGEESDERQFWLRTGVRMLSAQVEAMLFIMKRSLLLYSEMPEVGLTAEEKINLREVNDSTGKSIKMSLADSIKFVVKLCKAKFKTSHVVNLSGRDWENFLMALKVRDRLMHPKRSKDLIVTHAEYHNALASWEWLTVQLSQLLGTAFQR